MEDIKYYTSQEIQAKYDALSLEEKNQVLSLAIEYMQSYNGRTKFKCIAMSMGYDNDQGDNVSWHKRT